MDAIFATIRGWSHNNVPDRTCISIRRGDGGFAIAIADAHHTVVHEVNQDEMMSLVHWLQDGPGSL